MKNSKKNLKTKFYIKAILALAIFVCSAQAGIIENATQSFEENFYLAFNQLPKQNHVDTYFEKSINDPYQWIEKYSIQPDWFQQKNILTKFVEKNAKITNKYLGKSKDKILREIEKLQKFERFSVPVKRGYKYFYLIKKVTDKQPVFYMSNSNDFSQQKSIILWDPNIIDKTGNTAIKNIFPNHNGSMVAIQLTTKDQDFSIIKILNTENISTLIETLEWCPTNSLSVAWGTDNKGFYYNSNINPVNKEKDSKNRIFYHQLGTNQNQDVVVFENNSIFNKPTLSGKNLIITSGKKLSEYDLYLDQTNVIGNLRVKQNLSPVISGNYKNIFIGALGQYLFVQSNKSSNGEIIKINTSNREITTVIPKKENFVIDKSIIVNNKIVVSYMHNVHNEIYVFDLNGNFLYQIELPTIGSVLAFSAENEFDNELFIEFASFIHPRTTLKFDFNTKTLLGIWPTNPNIDFDQFEMKQIFYESKDGTAIPMFIMHKKGINLDGNNPTLMYGYGGLGVSLKPSTLPSPIFFWLQNGGIYVIPNLRGGGEFGSSWHKAGKLFNKQNVFDDFTWGAKWLIKNHYTKPQKLAIQGTCNGGLLVLNCMIQNPKLFGAVIPQVPLADMLRYDQLGNTKRYIPEFGSSKNNKEEFENLLKLSPLHQIDKITNHPPMLISIYGADDHITSAQPLKMFAALKEKNKGNVYMHFSENMGHYGRGNKKAQNEESAAILAFLFKTQKVN